MFHCRKHMVNWMIFCKLTLDLLHVCFLLFSFISLTLVLVQSSLKASPRLPWKQAGRLANRPVFSRSAASAVQRSLRRSEAAIMHTTTIRRQWRTGDFPALPRCSARPWCRLDCTGPEWQLSSTMTASIHGTVQHCDYIYP
eukprot:scpid85635/ scgid1560/ 